MGEFLRGVCEEGQARVHSGPAPPVDAASEARLVEYEHVARQELAGEAPPLSIVGARWSATLFYEACRFVACRDLGESEIVTTLHGCCPEPRSPSIDWSVDIVLRQLPQVFRLARHLSQTDPLLRELKSLAAQWPLSSVGMPDLGDICLESFINHPSLRQLYIDRVIRAQDVGRLGDLRIDPGICAALGAHSELAPDVARRLPGFPFLKDPLAEPTILQGK